ncbi:hypothetical protein [Ponticoccus litoralis]|uniref:Helix-turn-helix domain-containing protein n=1 Tax=Ponticoccus litoralis TaxID=422297 RepID=A0AAW9SRD1_9RHOB
MTKLHRDLSSHPRTGRPETSWKESVDGPPNSETSCAPVNRVSLQEVSRERFADLLRVAFPARSDAATARAAAAFLDVSDRAVLNWLRGETSAPFDAVFAIGCRVGVFQLMEVMTRGESRGSVLGRIVSGARRVFAR